MRSRAFLGSLLVLAALTVVAGWTVGLGGAVAAGGRHLMVVYAIGWLLFAALVVLVYRLSRRRAIGVILAGAALLQVVALWDPPTTTDDFYRYIWDGKVQASGVDPYRYVPVDPALTHLRDPLLFPDRVTADRLVAGAPSRGYVDVCTYLGEPVDCTLINRPTVRTIYPPVAEAAFLGLHVVSPEEHRVRAWQVAMGLLAWVTCAALVALLSRTGRDPRAAALWAFCPVVWLECGNNAHVDVLGILLLVGAFWLLDTRPGGGSLSTRRALALGGVFGAAVSVKLIPALVGPALLGRRAWLVIAGAAGVFLAGYVPHVAAVGTDVLGYLPGYLSEEGYSGQTRFAGLRLIIPDAWATAVAVAVIAAVAAVVWRRSATRPAAEGALLLVGTTFLVVGPAQPWYGLLIVMLAVLAARPEWLVVAVAAYPVYEAGTIGISNVTAQRWTYLPAAAIVLGVTLWRARRRPESPMPQSSMENSLIT